MEILRPFGVVQVYRSITGRSSDVVSASAVSRIAPGRGEQRHVVVPLGLGDREADRHHVEEWRIGRYRVLQAREVSADIKCQFIGADAQRLAADQWRIG